MNVILKGALAGTAIALLAAGSAQAALLDGTDGSNDTSVFISVVERDATNAIVRNLIIDTGVTTLDVFNGTPFSTTPEQEAVILNFLNTAEGSVRFNVGGALTDRTFGSDLYGFVTTGASEGPADGAFSQLSTATVNIQTIIGDANGGSFSADGVLAANGASDPGWHGISWGDSVGGAIQPGTEIAFGANSQVQAWRWDGVSNAIPNSILGPISSNLVTGDITFVPVPAAVWLFGSALGLLGWVRRRMAA